MHISTDPDLNSLQNDNRWKPLLEKIKQNKDKAEANLNKPLVATHDSIYVEDQKYGQQINGIDKKYGYISPLEDPDNVDKRRAEVGLGPLAEYVNNWQIKWDVEQYKKDLPKLEEKRRRK